MQLAHEADEDDAPTLPLSLPCPALLPQKSAFPTGIGITRRSRFPIAATGEAPQQARAVARSVLSLFLGSDQAAARTSSRVQVCLSELVAIAFTRTHGDTLLCEMWKDSEHVFVSVEHDEPLPLTADDSTIGLNVVKTVAHDYGSHIQPGSYQMWAAIRML